jgi:hypothetical protein
MIDGWKTRAACAEKPDLDWFAEWVPDEIFDTCRACPVRGDCLMHALDGDPQKELGIRAATTDHDRREIRAGRREPWEIWQRQEQVHLMLGFSR